MRRRGKNLSARPVRYLGDKSPAPNNATLGVWFTKPYDRSRSEAMALLTVGRTLRHCKKQLRSRVRHCPPDRWENRETLQKQLRFILLRRLGPGRGIGPPDRWENMKTLQKQLMLSFEYKGIGNTLRYAVEYEKGLR
ncbi:hypothetical protein JTB14_003563 [Gonioctena quinquepunctata]|nr:hypothetical protein JTB14_003563 [Gonioctena quinquepunctata]